MAGLTTLKSHRFRTEREQSWRELELILKAIEGRGMKSLSDEQIVALPPVSYTHLTLPTNREV